MADPVSALSILLALVSGGALLLWGKHYSLGWRGASKSGARLPKGSFGWPVIGETRDYGRNPRAFGSSRVKRYGKLFKSYLFGQPTIIGTTPEFAKFIISNSTLFGTARRVDQMQIIGHRSFVFQDGARHMTIKKVIAKTVLPEALRANVRTLETIIFEHLASWERRGTVVSSNEIRKITFDTAKWLILRDMGKTPEARKGIETFLENLKTVREVFRYLPTAIFRGAALRKGIKAKEDLKVYCKQILEERKGKENDVLGALLAALEDENVREVIKDFDVDTITDNLSTMWFATFSTTWATLGWIVKFMINNPEVFRRLQAEQQEILKGKDHPLIEGPRLTWEDTRKMVYAQKFLQEVQRVLSLNQILTKRANQDVEYEGYTIPKGWAVSILTTALHSDPDTHPDPESFNPDRFDVQPKAYTYIPFSGGPHMCPGAEFVKLISLIFIHHLTTTFTYESAEPDSEVEGGYPINVRRRQKQVHS